MSQRAKNINQEQKEILIEFVKKNPKLISGKFSKEFSYKDAQKLWQELANSLNSVVNGGKRDWNQWRKVWQDMRTKTKSKKAKIVKETYKTGGGQAENLNLSHTENAVLEMMSPVSWSGIVQATESAIESFEEIEMIENTMQNIPVENERVDVDKIIEFPNVSTEITPRGKRRKEERFAHTINAAKTLEEISKKKFELKEKYYEQKLKLMERDVQAKEDIAQCLKLMCNK